MPESKVKSSSVTCSGCGGAGASGPAATSHVFWLLSSAICLDRPISWPLPLLVDLSICCTGIGVHLGTKCCPGFWSFHLAVTVMLLGRTTCGFSDSSQPLTQMLSPTFILSRRSLTCSTVYCKPALQHNSVMVPTSVSRSKNTCSHQKASKPLIRPMHDRIDSWSTERERTSLLLTLLLFTTDRNCRGLATSVGSRGGY